MRLSGRPWIDAGLRCADFVYGRPERAKVFTPARASSLGGAAVLLPSLDPSRSPSVEALAKVANIRIEPTNHELAAWAVAVAQYLPTTANSAAKSWGPFYAELLQAFGTPDALRALAGKAILIERGGTLAAAGPNVYVRQEGARRSKSEAPPTPPRDVARVLSVLMEQVALRPEVFAAFERAGLWKRSTRRRYWRGYHRCSVTSPRRDAARLRCFGPSKSGVTTPPQRKKSSVRPHCTCPGETAGGRPQIVLFRDVDADRSPARRISH